MKSLALLGLALMTTSAFARPAQPPDEVLGRRRPPPPDEDIVVPPPPPEPVGEIIDQRAELTDGGEPVRVVWTSGGKKSGAKLEAKDVSIDLYKGEAIGTLKTAHGTTLVALSADDPKAPFRIALFDGKKITKVQKLARPAK